MSYPKTVVFDFDGLIHSYEKGWDEGDIYGTISERMIDVIQNLMKEGYAVVIMSTRDANQICDHLNAQYNDVDFVEMSIEDRFHNDTSFVGVTNRKIGAYLYVDDKAMRMTYEMVEKQESTEYLTEFLKKGVELNS